MKKILLSLFFILFFNLMLFGSDVGILLKVPGITWPGTAYRVSSTLRSMRGVKIVNTSVIRKEVYIKYDNSTITVKDILEKLKSSGYTAKVLKKQWNLI